MNGWYAWLMCNLEKSLPQPSVGKRYWSRRIRWSNFDTEFDVTLKLPEILTLRFDSKTGMMGDAHSKNCIVSKIMTSTCPILFQGKGYTKIYSSSASCLYYALYPLRYPRPFSKIFCFGKIFCNLSLLTN